MTIRAKLPNLFAALDAGATRIVIGGLGSSVGVGGGLASPLADAPCPKFVSYLNSIVRSGFEADNQSVNGTVINDYATALASLTDPDTKAVLIVYGMNDGLASQYNFGETLTLATSQAEAMVDALLALDIDPILVTSPHPHPERIIVAAPSTTAQMNYPDLPWRRTDTFTFAAATKRITCATAGAFTSGAGLSYLSVGKRVCVASGANQGLYTIVSIDASGDFLTASEALTDAVYSVQVYRADIQPEELTPPASASLIPKDWHGRGIVEVGSVRHGIVNQMLRDLADEKGTLLLDAEDEWFAAVQDYGIGALYDDGESVHPNVFGHERSYWRVSEAAAESIAVAMPAKGYYMRDIRRPFVRRVRPAI